MNHRASGKWSRRVGTGGLCLLLAGGLAGCDDFIVTEPRGQLVSENFFQTAEHAIQATNATYNMLRAWPVHVFAWIGMTDIASDDATKGSVPADAAFLLDLENLSFDPGNIAFNDTWTGYYQGIFRANVAIENIPRVTGSDALKARLIGENKFLRAYYYFFLVRAFGGVPLITQELRPGEFVQPRASADEVYAQIMQDLQDAIAVLPERSEYAAADVGRATRGAARAMLAQVQLYRGDYEAAYALATEVINSGQYSLLPNYEQIFTPAGENSSESVFEVQAVALETGGAGSQYSQVQGVRGTPNLGWGFNTPSGNLEAAYEPGDPRLQATIMYPWEQLPDGSGLVVHLNPSMPNNRYNQKAFIPLDTPGGTGNGGSNIRRIRYSDVLLIAAEAAYRTNRIGEAQALLNQVRARARGGRSATLGFSPELMAPSVASDVLGLPAGTSRVFVRYVGPGTAAHIAGLRNFAGVCEPEGCPAGAVPPVRVVHADFIQSVGGTPVTTLESFFNAVDTHAPGSTVSLEVLRLTHPEGGSPSTQTLTVNVPTQQLLPEVTATGQALLDAIWHERRVELAMEQHRWFDIVRQGRAPEVMAAAGKNFIVGTHERYPIPAGEVAIAGLQQNPGY
jgi:hypothetical protein